MEEPNKPGTPDHVEPSIISEREKPALDETTFQQLLEAAHVLQEQKAFEVANRPRPNPTEALAQIVETQEFLRSQAGDLQGTANVIVDRLQKITHATGVAVAVVRENRLEYCAATGDASSLSGSSLPLDSSLSSDGRLTTEFSREQGGKPSIALPLHHEGNLAGLLEIRFADANSIQEPEMRSCQLMAGLMTEAIARAADKEWRQTLAAERAAMLEALERIKPQLERLAVEPANVPASVVEPAARVVEPIAETEESLIPLPLSEASAKSGREIVCPQCGYQFGEQELFCGRCGSARPASASSSGDLQSKWASMWHLQQAAEQKQQQEENEETPVDAPEIADARLSHQLPQELSFEFPAELRKVAEQFPDEVSDAGIAAQNDSGLVLDGETAEEDLTPVSAATADAEKSPWDSASKAHKWLDSLHPEIGHRESGWPRSIAPIFTLERPSFCF